MGNQADYLVVGSGLAALSFGALMAKHGKRVKIIEAHSQPGGYGHTFEAGQAYKFNAQLHYVWNCGEGGTVNKLLHKLGLHDEVTFESFDPNGFDRMRMPGYALDIPYDRDELIKRLVDLFPSHRQSITAFIREVEGTARELDNLPETYRTLRIAGQALRFRRLLRYRSATLQDVFDRFVLPRGAQTLLALQWPDFLLPPEQLSFFAWVMLFTGYSRGAYYPTKHFEHFVDSLVQIIVDGGGEVVYNQRVTKFLWDDDRVAGVVAEDTSDSARRQEYFAGDIVCNMDPKRAASMIGLDRFSPKVRKQLDYDYSPSNFMAYCVVRGIDLRDHGFGKSNLFHSEDEDLNTAFRRMYEHGDYSRPSFAMTVPSLLTDDRRDCPDDCQIVEFLTVADYRRFLALKISDSSRYRAAKKAILENILDVVERDYVPKFREHLVFHMTGSPSTNERYCLSPAGNSYGSNLTPSNFGSGRLTSYSSLKNFYFCNASSGGPGFAGTVWTGAHLYEQLTGDRISRREITRRVG